MFSMKFGKLKLSVLMLLSLVGASGCVDPFSAFFDLGYFLGSSQAVNTCFLNGVEVDCGTLPEVSQ